MKTKVRNDITTKNAQMTKTDERCSCWEFDRKGRPLSERKKLWRADVMADGNGYCKHCNLPMKRFWPIKQKQTA